MVGARPNGRNWLGSLRNAVHKGARLVQHLIRNAELYDCGNRGLRELRCTNRNLKQNYSNNSEQKANIRGTNCDFKIDGEPNAIRRKSCSIASACAAYGGALVRRGAHSRSARLPSYPRPAFIGASSCRPCRDIQLQRANGSGAGAHLNVTDALANDGFSVLPIA